MTDIKSDGLAAMDPKNFGVVRVDQALQGKSDKHAPDISKFKELLGSIHDAAFPKGNVDDQTELAWENIEGEVMGEVLAHCLVSGTCFTQIDDDFFTFATPQECLMEIFTKEFLIEIKKKGFIIPSFSAMKENVNRLMISFMRKGRLEQAEMLKAFSISLAEQERTDPTKSLLRRL